MITEITALFLVLFSTLPLFAKAADNLNTPIQIIKGSEQRELEPLWALKLIPVIVELDGKPFAVVRGLKFFKDDKNEYYLATTEKWYLHSGDTETTLSVQPWTEENEFQGVHNVSSLRAISDKHEVKLHFFPNGSIRGFLDSHVIPTQLVQHPPAGTRIIINGSEDQPELDWYASLPPIIDSSQRTITFHTVLQIKGSQGSFKLLSQTFDLSKIFDDPKFQNIYYRATFHRSDQQNTTSMSITTRGPLDSEFIPETVGDQIDIRQTQAIGKKVEQPIKIDIDPAGFYKVIWPGVGTFHNVSVEFAPKKQAVCAKLEKKS